MRFCLQSPSSGLRQGDAVAALSTASSLLAPVSTRSSAASSPPEPPKACTEALLSTIACKDGCAETAECVYEPLG